jgi:antitoxin component of RelBE/YafQ-DinJ toxin-antitoxin module
MPNKPKTPSRNVRVDDELWSAALDRAEAEGITVADVIRDALRVFVARPKSRRASVRASGGAK